MADTKEMKECQEEVAEIVVVTSVPVQNDSSEGLARMYADLEEPAKKLRSSAFTLLLLSFLFCGSIEGIFAMIAALSVLCCAAPGSLGTAYAARCTRICAIVCAVVAFSQMMMLTAVSFMVPHMPEAVDSYCATMPVGGVVVATPPDVKVVAVPSPADDKPLAKEGAHKVVAFAVSGLRKLQEVATATAPMDDQAAQCEKAAYFTAEVLPYFVFFASIAELCLFIAAMTTARRALHLVLLARSMGANGL
jgi:hypothetical protein